MVKVKGRKAHRSSDVQDALISRLNRIEGQIRGVRKMILNEVYCDEIIHQISSVQSALGGVNTLLIENHLETCVADKIRSGDPHIIAEFTKTIRKVAQ